MDGRSGAVRAGQPTGGEGRVEAAVTLIGFERFQLGEGVDKPWGSDFASEVAATAGGLALVACRKLWLRSEARIRGFEFMCVWVSVPERAVNA
jgi:hypothetical protein